jgi:hypothetical protein
MCGFNKDINHICSYVTAQFMWNSAREIMVVNRPQQAFWKYLFLCVK